MGETLPFQRAIDALSRIPQFQTPTDKLAQILLASKEIEQSIPLQATYVSLCSLLYLPPLSLSLMAFPFTHLCVRRHSEDEGMGADELLPVLGFVLTHARMDSITSEVLI